jgi:hypothetical protein
MPLSGSKIDSNTITHSEYTQTHYEVANALGSPLPAPEGSAVYIAVVRDNNDSPAYESILGYYASEEAALAAIANDALVSLDDYGLRFPWDDTSAENYDDAEYWSADAIESRRDIWLNSKTYKQVAELFYEFPNTAEVIKVVVKGTPKIG